MRNLLKNTMLAFASCAMLSVTATNANANHIPFFALPTYTGGVNLISFSGPMPGNVPNPPGFASFPELHRQYPNPDPCIYARAGGSFGCWTADLLNSPADIQHWELEIYNPGTSLVTFNFVEFTLPTGAAYQVGLGAGSAIQFDFPYDDRLIEINTLGVFVSSGVPSPLVISVSVTEGGTPTSATPTMTPCPAITLGVCTYTFHSSPDDFILAGADAGLQTVSFGRPEDFLPHLHVPEPSSSLLIPAGIAGLGLLRRRRA